MPSGFKGENMDKEKVGETQKSFWAKIFPFTGLGAKNLKAFSLAAFLNDTGEEMYAPYLPLFAKVFLGVNPEQYGLIESLAESVNRILRFAAGALTDKIGRKKPVIWGYALIILSRLLLPLVYLWQILIPVRMLRQVGRTLRNPSREASIAESVPPEQRGKAYGLLESVDTMGAVLGPIIGVGLLSLFTFGVFKGSSNFSENSYRWLFACAAVPTVFSIAAISLFMQETWKPEAGAASGKKGNGIWHNLKTYTRSKPLMLVSASNMILAIGALPVSMMLFYTYSLPKGNAFTGTLVFVAYTASHSLSAYPAGFVADHLGRKRALLLGDLLLIFALAILIFVPNAYWMIIPAMLYGVFESLWIASRRAVIADLAPKEAMGQTLGTFSTLYGLTSLLSPIFVGAIWHRVNPATAFLACMFLCLLAAGLLQAGFWVMGRKS